MRTDAAEGEVAGGIVVGGDVGAAWPAGAAVAAIDPKMRLTIPKTMKAAQGVCCEPMRELHTTVSICTTV